MAVVCCVAFAIGRWPERASSVALALNWIGCALGQDRRPHHHGQPVQLALDIVLTAFLLLLTAACNRTWLLWMSACVLLVVLTHLAVLLDLRFGQWTYITAYYVWSIGVLLSLGVGAMIEGRRPAVPLMRFT